MNQFIELHIGPNDPLAINLAHLRQFWRNLKDSPLQGTTVELEGGGEFIVTETLEQVQRAISLALPEEGSHLTRECVAMHAMQGLLSRPTTWDSMEQVAQMSVAAADALFAALEGAR